jgi:Icc-related predicted phosphoesterase
MTRITFISDTHGQHGKLRLPAGDILVHSGDFLSGRLPDQGLRLLEFNEWLDLQPFTHKIVVAGNHDHLLGLSDHASEWRPRLTNCIYLEDEGVEVEGIKFYGSPWTPDFFPEHWVFNQTRGSEKTIARWAKIPDDTEVLITHGPPYKVLDQCADIYAPHIPAHVGCSDLRRRVRHLKNLKVHAFGHIHEGAGTIEEDGITFINASSLDGRYSLRKSHCTQYVFNSDPTPKE